MIRSGVAVAIVALLAGCGDDPVTAYFKVPGGSASTEFYELPFPNDLRRHADGTA